MLYLTSIDVHPPLYYIILKSVFELFCFLKIPFNDIHLGKMVSVIPMILLLIFSFTKIRKNFGWLSAGIFAMAMVTMPNLMFYGTNIRMYSWALLFVTLAFFYAYRITIKPNFRNWAFLSLFSLLSSYTHYFAGISSILIYLFLLIYFIFKNKKEIKFLIFSITGTILLYSPGVIVLINQINRIRTNEFISMSWIPPITVDSIFNYLWFLVSLSEDKGGVQLSTFSFVGITLLFIIISCFTLGFYFKKNDDKFLPIGGVLVLIATVLTGIILSLPINKTIFMERYMFPAFGCCWLSFTLLLSKLYYKKQIFIPLLIIFLIIGVNNTVWFINHENENGLISDIHNIQENINDNVNWRNSQITEKTIKESFYKPNNSKIQNFNFHDSSFKFKIK
jgi:hypothetical protein